MADPIQIGGVLEPGGDPEPRFTQSDAVVRLIFGSLAICFATVGCIFLIFPDGTVRTINAVGAAFRVFSPAPQSELRFWLSLAVAYMALVTVLATMIQRDPRRYRHLMPILACGKFFSSSTCLLFFVFSSPTFLYLLNCLVDGSITLVVLGCYAWMTWVDTPATAVALDGRSGPILDALLDTMLPAGGAFALGGRLTPLRQDFGQYFGQLHARGPVGLALLLHALEYGPYILGPKRRRFTALRPDERQRYLSGFEDSRWALRRQLILSIKLIVMLHFYGYPEAQRAVGYDGHYLREKLLAGPNAVHHRVRLQ